MKINLDRLCKLAGVESGTKTLNEASNRSYHEETPLSDESEHRYGKGQLSEELEEGGHYMEADGDADDERGMDAENEGMHHMEGEGMEEDMHMEEMEEMEEMEDMDELIDVDEAMLVQEIRRARQMISESRKAKKVSPATLAEQKLKKIVAEEVENVMKDLNLTSGWVYGDRKPTNSRKGVVNTAFPGIGFRNSK
jgi:hypothetical protein